MSNVYSFTEGCDMRMSDEWVVMMMNVGGGSESDSERQNR